MADLIQIDTDEEMDKYAEAELIAQNPPPVGAVKEKTVNYNPTTGRNDVLTPLSAGGYVKIGDEELPRVEQVQKYSLQLEGRPFDMADYEVAGFSVEEVQAAGIMPVKQEEPVRTEPLREGEVLRTMREGSEMASVYDPTLRENTTNSLREIFVAAGLDNFQARQIAEGILGNPASTRDLGIGVADFTPAGLFFGAQEGYRTFERGVRTGDPVTIGMGALEAGLSLLEAVPITAAGARAAKAGIPKLRGAIADLGQGAEARMAERGSTTLFSNPVEPAVDQALAMAGRAVGGDAPNVQRPDQVLVKIPIEDVEHGESAMPGGKLTLPGSQQLIQEYASKETPLPPIDIMSLDEDGAGKAFIADGSHRFEAAKLRGQDFVEAYVSKDELADLPSADVVGSQSFDVTRKDASGIFGQGTERVRYTDPASGGTMEVVVRPDGSASVLELEVPEEFRGQGIGQQLQEKVMQDFPVMSGQVSSKAAATTAYRLGRRPPNNPDATLEDVFAEIDEMSSVNMVSPEMQARMEPKAAAPDTSILEMNLKSTPRLAELFERAEITVDSPIEEIASTLRRAGRSDIIDKRTAETLVNSMKGEE